MVFRPYLSSFAGILSAGALLLVGLPAHAEDTPGITPKSEQISTAEQSEAEQYWTPERMANAQEVTLEVTGADMSTAHRVPQSTGPQRSVEPKVTSENLDSVGKVFFSTSAGDFVCSANIVTSGNASTIATAGHCLHGGEGGRFASNFVFAPGYDHGVNPEHGLWAAEELVTSPGWAESGDISADLGFAKLETKNGQTIESAVGDSTGIVFNQARGGYYTAYGYPAASPFDGQSLESCAGTAADDTFGRTRSQGIPCDLTGGSSGGPWFLGGADGPQNSVNSFVYGNLPTMYGPYYGDEAAELYDYTSAL